MSSILPHRNGWRVFVSVNGKRASKVFPTMREAREWSAAKQVELGTGPAVRARGGLHELLDRFVRDACPGRKGGDQEIKRIARLKRELPDVPLIKLDAPVLADWRDRRLKTVKASSVLRDMTLLRAVFELARREWRALAINPLADVKRPPPPPPRNRLITQAEIDAVVQALTYRDDMPVVLKRQQVAVLFLLAIETGMRAGELLRCKVEGRVAYLATTKNGDPREVPLTKRAVELFGKVPGGFTVGAGTRDALFREARDKAGLSGFTFHDARAVAATRLSRKLQPLELARVLGHRDLKSVMIYYRESAESLANRLD